MTKRLGSLSTIFAVALACTASAAFGQEPDAVEGELLVRFRRGAQPGAIAALYRVEGLVERDRIALGRRSDDPGLRRVRVPAAAGDARSRARRLRGLAERLARHPQVAYAEPNYIIRAADVVPNDPRFSELWGLRNTGQSGGLAGADIGAPEAWSVGVGDSTIVIAVLDSGVDYTHEDLVANLWINPGEIPGNGIDDDGNGWVDDVHGINAIEGAANPGDPMDDRGHGTHCAGTIGATGNNGTGIVGVAWNARIMSLKFLGANGSGTTADAVKAFEYVNRMKHVHGINIRVTSNSWISGGDSQALREAMAGLDQPGMTPILHVVAAGNSSTDVDALPMYPAAYDLPNLVTVAATDRLDHYAAFSSYGAASVHLAAPGDAILSTVPTSGAFLSDPTGYRLLSGTSMATPHVAGAALLLLAAEPSLTAAEAKARLIWSSDWIADHGANAAKPTESGGRLHMGRAITNLDTTPPAAVTDLAVTAATMSTADLAWTATGDDGTFGQARGYDLRYALAPITNESWDQATRVAGEPHPGSPGASESIALSGLPPLVTLHFAMKVFDDRGNASPLSNGVSVETGPNLTLFADDAESASGGMAPTGRWHRSTLRAWSPTHAWFYGDGATGDLGASNVTHLGELTLPASVSVGTDTALTFRHALSRASGDIARILVSLDDGATWTVLATPAPTGGAFVEESAPLGLVAGQDVLLRFQFIHFAKPVGTPSEEGWYVDDIRVVASRTDLVPPAAASDLAVTAAGLSTVTLAWTAPGNDESVGTAHRYDLRYAAAPLHDGNWDAPTTVRVQGEPTPQPAGSAESFTIHGLQLGETLHFALRTRDFEGNWSPLSPSIEASTAAGVTVFADDMESGSSSWITYGDPSPPLWHRSTTRKVSGSTSWSYSIPGPANYDTGARNWGALETALPIDLADASAAALTFWEWRSTETDWWKDRTRVEVSTNDGATWSLAHETVSPSSHAWLERRVDLGPWVGQSIRVRFHFDTIDAFQNFFSGWNVDDVRVVVLPMTEPPPPPAPIAAFDAPTTTNPGDLVFFDDRSQGEIDTWSWDFGDGAGSSEPSPVHAYGEAGAYAVTLTVTGPGGSSEASSTVTVVGEAHVTAITYVKLFGWTYSARIALADAGGAPIAGANVTIAFRRGSVLVGTYAATTSASGLASIVVPLAQKGCYSSTVTAVDAPGHVWSGTTPPNQVCR